MLEGKELELVKEFLSKISEQDKEILIAYLLALKNSENEEK